MKYILVLFFLSMQGLAMASAPAIIHKPGQSEQHVVAPTGVILELVLNGRHLATWNALPGAGNYNIGIINLDTNVAHAVMTSPTNSAVISGLVAGNTYQFTIEKNGYIIIDIIDI